MNCPKCFSPLRPGQPFCEVCGTKIASAGLNVEKTVAADPADLTDTAPQEQPKPWRQQTDHPVPWQQQTEQPVSQQQAEPTFPWEQKTEQPSPWEQKTEQPSPWQQKTEQPVPRQQMQQPASPQEQPNAWQPPAPQPPSSDVYAQQFQQYRQSSPQKAGSRKGDGSLPPEKNTAPLIIVIIVLAVLLVGGGVVAAILLLGNKGGDQPAAASSTVTTAAQTDGSSQSSSESSAVVFGSLGSGESSALSSQDESSREESSRLESSSRVESDTTASGRSSSSAATDLHTIVNAEGVVLVTDEDIDTGDIAAQQKLEKYMKDNNVPVSMSSGSLEGIMYVKGNTVVYEYTYTTALSAEQEAALRESVSEMEDSVAPYVAQMEDEADVDEMVAVYAYFSTDGKLIASIACHSE